MRIKDFKLEEYFAKHEFNVKYTLCSSDCESFSVDELLTLEKDSLEDLKGVWLGYTESLGSPILREEISKLYENIHQEEVLVFSGAEEAIFVFMNVFLSKGDHIIVQYPAYQSLYEIANAIGCKVTKWLMDDENNWELDLDFLEANVNQSTKCIVLNFPNNPTGYLPSKEKYNRIVNLAKKNDVYLLSDEVYKFLEYSIAERLPSACDLYNKGISIGVMSKSFGLAGLRIGWIATKDKALYKAIASFKNYTTICNSALSEFFAIMALRNKSVILKRNLGIISDNLNLLDNFFYKYKDLFKWIKPKAGSIAFPRLLVEDSVEDFCLGLLKEKNVLLMPSTNYNYGDRYFRIGFGRKNMPEALKKLEEYIKEKYEALI
ncbi:MAG: aminotransferase class I/II-fold pyridoxal phosphate-dependent enzyme [Candidatus Lokiarchaeota archaeon]|nr:aminotransferase class I/II-fold pyridoxal phosphate-dependent enzyme [Candidatus Lokiarchaeota archaeon]